LEDTLHSRKLALRNAFVIIVFVKSYSGIKGELSKAQHELSSRLERLLVTLP
jgi:hypothetical protein